MSLAPCKHILGYNNGNVAIHPKFKNYHSAVEKGEGTLDKEATSHDDVIDALTNHDAMH